MVKVVKPLATVPRMNLELELTDGQLTLVGVSVNECRERVKLATLNVNLEHIDECMT
jgi:hypothetical protein